MTGRPVVLALKEIWFTYPGRSLPVLQDISLTLPEGTWLSVVGGNGSGKSTLGKLCAGLLVPQRGAVRLPLRTEWLSSNPLDTMVGATVEEEVAFNLLHTGCRMAERALQARVTESLREVGLSGDFLKKDLLKLSGGERQLVALASALVTRPQLLILDEPVSMLDEGSRATVLSVITRLVKELKVGLLHLTHDIAEAASADMAVVVHKGRLLACGPPGTVFAASHVLQAAGLEPL